MLALAGSTDGLTMIGAGVQCCDGSCLVVLGSIQKSNANVATNTVMNAFSLSSMPLCRQVQDKTPLRQGGEGFCLSCIYKLWNSNNG